MFELGSSSSAPPTVTDPYVIGNSTTSQNDTLSIQSYEIALAAQS